MSCTENRVPQTEPRTVFATLFKFLYNVTNYVRDDDPSKASALRARGGTSPPTPSPYSLFMSDPPLPEFLHPPLLCVCSCVCVHVYACVLCMCVHVCTCECVCACVCMCVHMCVHLCTCECVCAHVCACVYV